MEFVRPKIHWRILISRGILFFFIWWILTDGAVSSWWIGVPAVLLALSVSMTLIPSGSLVWYEIVRFIPFFITRSLMGGMDVAWRAFHPRIPIDPDLVEYPLRLPPGLSRVFMANIISLLPGTLSAELDESVLKVHVLDRRKEFLAELEAVEQRMARMFSAPLKVSSGGR